MEPILLLLFCCFLKMKIFSLKINWPMRNFLINAIITAFSSTNVEENKKAAYQIIEFYIFNVELCASKYTCKRAYNIAFIQCIISFYILHCFDSKKASNSMFHDFFIVTIQLNIYFHCVLSMNICETKCNQNTKK